MSHILFYLQIFASSSLSLQSTVLVPLPTLCVADTIPACLLLQEAFPDHLSTQVRAGVILWCLSSSSIHSHRPSSSLSLAPSEVRQPLQKWWRQDNGTTPPRPVRPQRGDRMAQGFRGAELLQAQARKQLLKARSPALALAS